MNFKDIEAKKRIIEQKDLFIQEYRVNHICLELMDMLSEVKLKKYIQHQFINDYKFDELQKLFINKELYGHVI